jgi:hypothetical protein
MSNLHYLCLLRIVVSSICCVVFWLCLSSSCVPYVASFSRLLIFDCPFDIVLRLFSIALRKTKMDNKYNHCFITECFRQNYFKNEHSTTKSLKCYS